MEAEVRDRFALREWMEHRGSSVRRVAAAATLISERDKDHRPPIKVNSSTVGHLISGHQKKVSARRAECIERALDVPRGSLFMYKLTNVSGDESYRRSA